MSETRTSQAVTRRVAGLVADCFTSLVERGIFAEAAQRFIMQMLTALFAQNIEVTRILEDRKTRPGVRDELLGQLFTAMAPEFDGGLFAQPARIELTKAEIELLLEAAASDWSRVWPGIFGSLLEHSLEHDPGERHRKGMHFTSPDDIMKIVGPTIGEPWQALIDAAPNQRALRTLLARMRRFQVLDPACGSGNFLYIAYRELRRLEARICERITTMPRGEFVTASQFHGMDASAFAIDLAKITMIIARKLENCSSSENLAENFRCGDALVNDDGTIPPWPRADVILGNPPFLDARRITLEHGREYVNRLRHAYPDIPGRADYCVYWFRRAHDAVPAWTREDPVSGRVGLVGTNSIRQNYSREGGLDHVVANGGVITDAVASQVWPGTAAVHVSIVNWVKGPYEGRRVLQEQLGDSLESEWIRAEVGTITSALTSHVDVSMARELEVVTDRKRCFEGQQPGHKQFRIGLDQRRALARKDAKLAEITFQYMIGGSLLSGKHETAPEFVIDFGDCSMRDAAKHRDALAHVRAKVLPQWQSNAENEAAETGSNLGEHRRRLQAWWKLKRRRPEMLAATSELERYIVCVRHTKRPIFVFLDSRIRPDSALTVFAFEDDYSFGILQSNVHWAWFLARCSSLKRDFRYTKDTVFDSFPWPQAPPVRAIERVAKCARELRAVRRRALDGWKGGLRALYKQLEADSGESPLGHAHRRLDSAVMKVYRFDEREDVLTQILDLNRSVADAGARAIGPGIPAICRDRSAIMSEDRILPYLDGVGVGPNP